MVPKAVRAARQKGRKGECCVINITKNWGETEGYRRQLKEKKSENETGQEGG